MSKSVAEDLQYSSQAACLRAICQRASIKLGLKRMADSFSLLPFVCLYISDIGENGIIFNITNNAPGIYEIKGINYHDDGLLGAAVKLGHISGPGTEVLDRDVLISGPSNQSNPGDALSDTVVDGSASNHGGPDLFAYGDNQSESLVTIFDLHNGKGFSDIIYALIQGSLSISLQILDLETHRYMRCINDKSPMIG
jgi:hypothetical protein